VPVFQPLNWIIEAVTRLYEPRRITIILLQKVNDFIPVAWTRS